MNKIYLFIFSLFCLYTAQAQNDYKMVIHKNDGSQLIIPTQDIKEVSFLQNQINFTLQLATPKSLKQAELVQTTATFTNTQTQQKYTFNSFQAKNGYYEGQISIPQGNYNVEILGKVNYQINTLQTQTTVRAAQNNVEVNDAGHLALVLQNYNETQGLVISEIFFSGSQTPEKKQYLADQYIILTNNSDHTIYADSIAFLSSKFLTNKKFNYSPNLINEAFIVDAIYMIPGNGKDHPLQPKQSLVLALNVIDHRPNCSTSFDLSHADFEFFDVTTKPKFTDIDNEQIPNLDRWYAETLTYFLLHSRGLRSFAIAKLHGTKKDFIQNYTYNAQYPLEHQGIVSNMNVKAMLIPNTWIIDAVNVSTLKDHVWNVTSPTLDNGFTYTSLDIKDKTAYGLSIIRKKDATGKYIDTNNSTNDFLPRQKASLRTN